MQHIIAYSPLRSLTLEPRALFGHAQEQVLLLLILLLEIFLEALPFLADPAFRGSEQPSTRSIITTVLLMHCLYLYDMTVTEICYVGTRNHI